MKYAYILRTILYRKAVKPNVCCLSRVSKSRRFSSLIHHSYISKSDITCTQVGVFMPFGMQLELSGLPENGVSTLCIVPYCIVIALCSVSVLVTVAIAVDRLTSLAQPLRYKNIITHSSIEKYITVFWIYAIAVGLSPLIYVKIVGVQSHRWVKILSQFSFRICQLSFNRI